MENMFGPSNPVQISPPSTPSSPRFSTLRIGVVRQLIAATEQLAAFPESGRTVPEFDNPRFARSSTALPNRLPLGGRESDPRIDASSWVAATSVEL